VYRLGKLTVVARLITSVNHVSVYSAASVNKVSNGTADSFKPHVRKTLTFSKYNNIQAAEVAYISSLLVGMETLIKYVRKRNWTCLK
jgi:hypothetical protein